MEDMSFGRTWLISIWIVQTKVIIVQMREIFSRMDGKQKVDREVSFPENQYILKVDRTCWWCVKQLASEKTWVDLWEHDLETILEWALNNRNRNFIPDPVNKGNLLKVCADKWHDKSDF